MNLKKQMAVEDKLYYRVDDDWYFCKKANYGVYTPISSAFAGYKLFRASLILKLNKDGSGQVLKSRTGIKNHSRISQKDMLVICLQAKQETQSGFEDF